MNTQEYESVWSGNTWRQFPTLPAPPLSTPHRGPTARDDGSHGRLPVLRALRDSWSSLRAISDRAGLSSRTTWNWLHTLAEDGQAEQLTVTSTKQGGRPQKLYRRRRREAAA